MYNHDMEHKYTDISMTGYTESKKVNGYCHSCTSKPIRPLLCAGHRYFPKAVAQNMSYCMSQENDSLFICREER